MKTIEYKDDVIYNGKVFFYNVYDVGQKELISLFNEQQKVVSRRLMKGSAEKWIQSKIELYGIAISKPELFTIVTPTGLNAPYSFYSIKLNKQYGNT